MMYFRGSPPKEEVDEQDDMFRKKVQSLWHEECLVDVSLACENEILTAHKLVLSAYSDYFKNIFLSMMTANQYPVIFMKDVSCDVLKAILKFMYCGEVNVAQSNLNNFMKTARALQIKGLSIITDDENESMDEYPTKKRYSSIEKMSDRMSDKMSDRQHSSPPMKKMRPQPSYDSNEEEEMDSSYHSYKSKECRQRRSSSTKGQENPRRLSGSSGVSQDNISHHRASTSSAPVAQETVQPHRSSNSSLVMSQETASQCRPSGASSAQHKAKNSQHENKSSSGQNRQMLQPAAIPNQSYNQSEDELPNSGGSSCELEESENESNENVEAVKPAKELQLFHHSRGDKYQEEDLLKAIKCVQGGMTFAAAAKAYNIPARTLSSKLQIIRAATNKNGKEQSMDQELGMSLEQEEKLMSFIDYMSQITPLTCNQVRLFAWGIDSAIGGNTFGKDGPTKNWWNHFKRKHPKINKVLRKVDFLKSSKLKSESFSFKSLIDYLVPIQEIIEAFDLNDKPGNIWSCSEYTVNLQSSPAECFFPSRKRFISEEGLPTEGDFASVMFAGSALGKTSPPFLVFKDAVPAEEYTKDGPPTAMYDKNSTGLMDSDLMLKWFEHTFLPQCPKNRSEENPVILLVNSSFSLTSPEMLELALSEHVMLLSLMPHLHHACQPMDLPIMNRFRKSFMDKLKGEKIQGAKGFKNAIPKVIKEPFEKGFSGDETAEGFQICGIFPLMVEVDQKKYLKLREELKFSAAIKTSLKGGSGESEMEKLVRTQNRKIKLLQKRDKAMSTDEEEEQPEDTNCCYVCDNPFNAKGDAQKKIKCTKRHCKNYSCDECLPINYDQANGFICIDCRPNH